VRSSVIGSACPKRFRNPTTGCSILALVARLARALLLAGACTQPEPAAPAPAPTPQPAPRSPPAATPAPAPAQPAGLAGTWVGTYAYPDPTRAPVRFFVELRDDGGTLSGSMLEPNTFGDAHAVQLRATVAGRRESDGRVRFDKTYDGAAGVDHAVRYQGTLDGAGTRIDGTWEVGESSGRFTMERWGALTAR
jgi:hypothetical protein